MKLDGLKALWGKAFGDSEEMIELFFQTAYAPQRCRYLEEGGQVTSALYWMDAVAYGQKLAYIYGVATDPDHRGKGLCRKLMEKTHEDLAEQGCSGAILMPAEPGLRKMYASMGYQECSTMGSFACQAGDAVAVRRIDREEYALLRRKYLPEGGVIQEGESLAYLQTYAQFYAGEDFLLAAVHETDSLFGVELLGNQAAAPGILKAMGYEQGTFRTPDGETPFAMYLPLTENAKKPTYLGLAFD